MEPEEKTEMTPTPPEPMVTEEKKDNLLERFWFVPFILAIVAVIIVGALWMINKDLFAPKLTPTPSPSPTAAEIDSQTSALGEQETSDEIEAIETDLEATDLSNIDKELTDIENELSAP